MRRKLKSINLVRLLVSPYMSGTSTFLECRRYTLMVSIPYGVIIRSAYFQVSR